MNPAPPVTRTVSFPTRMPPERARYLPFVDSGPMLAVGSKLRETVTREGYRQRLDAGRVRGPPRPQRARTSSPGDRPHPFGAGGVSVFLRDHSRGRRFYRRLG